MVHFRKRYSTKPEHICSVRECGLKYYTDKLLELHELIHSSNPTIESRYFTDDLSHVFEDKISRKIRCTTVYYTEKREKRKKNENEVTPSGLAKSDIKSDFL